MRNAFVSKLSELARSDDRVILITADLGYGLFDAFRKNFPNQFLNVGVAEQNMIGIASGLALEGYVPFCYSIANFSFMRCLEQIRNDVCYHDLNVTIVSNGAGFSYGPLGMSHHATEDISIMRAIPNIEVLIPATPIDTEYLTNYAYKSNKPSYLRLDKSKISLDNSRTTQHAWELLVGGDEICFIACGGIVDEALKASAEMKAKFSINAKVISVKQIILNSDTRLTELLSGVRLVLTLEENVKSGGLGSYILEQLNDNNMDIKVIRLGIDDKYESIVGDQQYLRRINGLTSDEVVNVVTSHLGIKENK